MTLKTSVRLHTGMQGKIRLNKDIILSFLFLITPLMDTLNGWYVLGHGETSVSIGTFYRLFILLFIFVFYNFSKNELLWLIITAYFPISSAVRAIIDGISFFSAFTYGLKWMLPIIYILVFSHINKKEAVMSLQKIIDVWKFLIPSILIVEYVLGIGEATYYDAGFRGLFYCINDIGFSLTMMSIYSIYAFIMVKMSFANLIPVVLNLVAILILSTKSCILFTAISVVIYLLKKSKKSPHKSIGLIIFMVLMIPLIMLKMADSIDGIVRRYTTFYMQTVGSGFSFSNMMGFLTSARTYRIEGTLANLMTNFCFNKMMFGWCDPIFTGAIEMDWLDVLFQHGIIGLLILTFFYYKIIFAKKYNAPYKYMLVIAMICALFSGHVLNGALPSTVFAVVVGLALNSINGRR